MKRIALFLPTLMGGGAEKVMINLANELSKQYHVELIVATSFTPLKHLLHPSVTLTVFQSSRIIFSLPLLIAHLLKTSPHVLVSALDYANIIAIIAARLTATPLVISEHSTATLSLAHAPSLRAKVLPFLIRTLYPFAQGIVAVSQGVARDLEELSPRLQGRIDVIYNPILETLPPLNLTPVTHPFLEASTPLRLIAAGRLTRPKNFPLLLDAFALVRQQLKGAKLIILGEGEEREVLHQMIISLGLEEDVDLVGFVPNPKEWFASSDIFVLSSSWEGLGNVLVEALASGCCVVSTDCPSGPREILEGGKWGKLLISSTPQELCKAILETKVSACPLPSPSFFTPFTLSYATHAYAKLSQKVMR